MWSPTPPNSLFPIPAAAARSPEWDSLCHTVNPSVTPNCCSSLTVVNVPIVTLFFFRISPFEGAGVVVATPPPRGMVDDAAPDLYSEQLEPEPLEPVS